MFAVHLKGENGAKQKRIRCREWRAVMKIYFRKDNPGKRKEIAVIRRIHQIISVPLHPQSRTRLLCLEQDILGHRV
jgi:hypothetical protein